MACEVGLFPKLMTAPVTLKWLDPQMDGINVCFLQGFGAGRSELAVRTFVLLKYLLVRELYVTDEIAETEMGKMMVGQ